MLTLAAFVVEKFGGDSMADVQANLAAYRARSRGARSPVAGGDPGQPPRPDRHRRGRLRRGRLSRDGHRARRAARERQERRRHGGSPSATARRSSTSTSGSRARAGRPIPEIFADDGEAAFRRLERAGRDRPRSGRSRTRRSAGSIATGGGAIVDPRNRWALYRGRTAVWLDGRPEVLAQRLRRSPHVRPLVAGARPDRARSATSPRDASGSMPPRDIRVTGVAEIARRPRAIEERLAEDRTVAARPCCGPTRRSAGWCSGDGIAAAERRRRAERAPGTAGHPRLRAGRVGRPSGSASRPALAAAGWTVETILLPQGEDAKRLSSWRGPRATSSASGSSVASRSSRSVAVPSATRPASSPRRYLRGVPLIHVPTTLVAQIDSSIGGKTGVDLPEGKNLVGAFHQPVATIVDVAVARDPARTPAAGRPRRGRQDGGPRRRAPVRAAGDGRDGDRAAATTRSAIAGVVAELVERCAWAKVEVVVADERERDPAGGRITLNLGHSIGHAVEAAAGYGASSTARRWPTACGRPAPSAPRSA